MPFHLGRMEMEKYITDYGLHPCLGSVNKAMTEKGPPNLRILYGVYNRTGKAFCLY